MEPYGILQLPEQPRYDLTEQYFCKNSHLIEIVAMFQCYQDNFLAITHIYIYTYIGLQAALHKGNTLIGTNLLPLIYLVCMAVYKLGIHYSFQKLRHCCWLCVATGA